MESSELSTIIKSFFAFFATFAVYNRSILRAFFALFATSAVLKRFKFALFAVLLTTGCRPQTPTTDILHTVEKNGSTFHILGSMHLGKGMVLSDTVKRVIEDVDEVVFEIDMKEMTDQEAAAKLLPLMMLPEGKSLEDIYSPEKVVAMKEKYKKAGVMWMLVQNQKPLFGAMTAIGVAAMKQGMQAEKGTEFLVYDHSEKFKKPTSGLETMEYQMSLFDSISYDMQYKITISTLERLDSLKGDLTELLDAFQSGDAGELEKFLQSDLGEGDEIFNRVFLVNRNKAWAEKLNKLAGSGKKFLVVVGAAHLVGAGSLLEFLGN